MNKQLKRRLKRLHLKLGSPAEGLVRSLFAKSSIQPDVISKVGTEYCDHVDPSRLRNLNSYHGDSTTQSLDTTIANVNSQFFDAYGPEFLLKTAAHISVDPPWYYHDLLKRLSELPNLHFRTCRDALATCPVEDEIICTIRHDVDGDLPAAIQQAKIEKELSVPTSYYLLHNAPYYGALTQVGKEENSNRTVFSRHTSSMQAYLEIQSLGHEIALHTDGMDYYHNHNTDGAMALESEIKWLRDSGCEISGTTAHNSISVYGCNNYSIFKHRPLGLSLAGGPKAVLHNGSWAPLQVLDEEALNLDYEANDLFWQDETPLLYGCLMTQNNWYIADNQYGMLSPETKDQRPPLRGRYGTHEDLIDAIKALEGPAYVKLVVHPMHYGLRAAHTELPWLPTSSIDQSKGKAKMWSGGGENDSIEGTAINFLNEFSTPDRGLSSYQSGDFRIVVMGNNNILSHTVSADSKLSQVAARLIRGPLKKPTATAISVAYDNLDVQSLKDSLEKITSKAKPDVIILSIDDFELDQVSSIDWIKQLSQEYCLVILLASDSQRVIDEFSIDGNTISNLLVIDTNQEFSYYQGGGKLTWHESKDWTPQAHYLVGKKVSSEIIKFQNSIQN